LHVVCKHAQKDVGANTAFEAMVDWAHHEIYCFN